MNPIDQIIAIAKQRESIVGMECKDCITRFDACMPNPGLIEVCWKRGPEEKETWHLAIQHGLAMCGIEVEE